MTVAWPELPLTVDEVDADWLLAALRAGGAPVDGPITGIELEPITAAVGLMGEVTRLSLSGPDGGAGPPASVVAKLPSALPDNRALGLALGFYEVEHRFYAELAGRVGLRTPHVWFTGAEPEAGRYALLLEDLGGHERHDQLDGAPIHRAEAMIDAVASMHARYWGLAPLAGHDWVPEGSGEALAPFAELVSASWPAFDGAIATFADDDDRALVRRFVEGFERLAEMTVDHPQTLVHRDFRLDNALFDGETPVVFDWGGAARAGGFYDLHYFLGGSLTSEDRADHWRRLVDRYLTALVDDGVDLGGAPLDEMHRANALFCLTVPVMAGGDALNTRDEKGERLIRVGLRRLFDHLHDLDAVAVLD
jgi:hypothetical protein